MARGILALIASLPPIDFAALAERKRDACRWTKKGDKRPRADVEKQWAAYRENRRRRQEAAAEKFMAPIEAERKRRRAPRLDGILLCAMTPGHWYARPDIRDLSGVKCDSVKAMVAKFLARGWIERVENPDYAPTKYQKGVPIHTAPRGCDIRWLYRLTPAGEAKRASVAFMA